MSRFRSIAGAHPKNVASESHLYGDINVLSAVNTIFGLGIFYLNGMPKALILNLAGVAKLDFLKYTRFCSLIISKFVIFR